MFAVHAVSLCAFILALNSFILLSNNEGLDCTVINYVVLTYYTDCGICVFLVF